MGRVLAMEAPQRAGMGIEGAVGLRHLKINAMGREFSLAKTPGKPTTLIANWFHTD
jgi:hypothetical protein